MKLYERYLISEVKMTSTEKKEWDDLSKWAKSKGFKNFKNGNKNTTWDKKGNYIDGWADSEGEYGFSLYKDDDFDVSSLAIQYYVDGSSEAEPLNKNIARTIKGLIEAEMDY